LQHLVNPSQRVLGRIAGFEEHWNGFARHHRANFNRLGEHLGNPSATPLFQEVSTAGRGAAWQFLRYAADRKGGEVSTISRALANAPVSGLCDLERALGDDPMIWLRDWAIAVYTDDAIPHVVSTWRHNAETARRHGIIARSSQGSAPTTPTRC
jgi:hypothetical protein